MKIEHVIFSGLLQNADYMRKVLPFLKSEYFSDPNEKNVFNKILEYVEKYNNPPTHQALDIELQNLSLSDDDLTAAASIVVDSLAIPQESSNLPWMLETTEKFCKDKALYNAIFKSIEIIDDKGGPNKSKLSKNAIPELMRQALSTSFDNNIGHDYLDDLKLRYDLYHLQTQRIPFKLDWLNHVTKKGIPKKALCIVAAPPGCGKSLFLCDHAANCLRNGNNVLYITLEMAEERIAERIDANLMDIAIDDIGNLPYQVYEKRFERVKKSVSGRLVIKEYPTGSAGAMAFRSLIDELKIKKSFVADVIIVDYLGICCSDRFKASKDANSYTIVKSIAEELRRLGVEENAQVFTAAQINRSGTGNSDIDMTHIAESTGINQTADFMFVIISSDELDNLGQVMFKLLKNRYGDISSNKKQVVGVDKTKMRFYNVGSVGQANISSGPAPFAGGSSQQQTNNFEDWS